VLFHLKKFILPHSVPSSTFPPPSPPSQFGPPPWAVAGRSWRFPDAARPPPKNQSTLLSQSMACRVRYAIPTTNPSPGEARSNIWDSRRHRRPRALGHPWRLRISRAIADPSFGIRGTGVLTNASVLLLWSSSPPPASSASLTSLLLCFVVPVSFCFPPSLLTKGYAFRSYGFIHTRF
jgi:hypothetical protein